MADELRRIVIPALYRHFAKPILKRRLRCIAMWGNSFEKWLQWEAVFALQGIMKKMTGSPWKYEEWFIEHPIKRRQVDMFMGGADPLVIQFKAYTPCFRGHRKEGRSSLPDDIESLKRFSPTAAACLLFTIEHHGAEMDFSYNKVPRPHLSHLPKIPLGKTWCDFCGKYTSFWWRFYAWTNKKAANRKSSKAS